METYRSTSADDCGGVQQLHRPDNVNGVHPCSHLDLHSPRQVVEKLCLTDISHQGFLPHSAPDHTWKRRRDSPEAVHSSKVPWDFGLTRGRLCVISFVNVRQVHVWTLTPSDMVLTAHITYQNQKVYTAIHTQVFNQNI